MAMGRRRIVWWVGVFAFAGSLMGCTRPRRGEHFYDHDRYRSNYVYR